MEHHRFLQLAVFISLIGLVVTSCLPGPGVPVPRQADDQSRVAAEVAVTVDATPLRTPVFGGTVAGDGTPAPSLPPDLSVTEPPAPTAARTADFGAGVATAWFELAYQLAAAEKLPPPLVSRLFGYTGVALYEAVVPGMPGFESLAGQLNELQPLPPPDPQATYHWPAVANAALATLLRTLLAGASTSTARALIEQERQLADHFAMTVPADVLQRSIAHGQRIGLAVSDWAQADGIDYLSDCAYAPPSGPGLWEPTPPQYAAPLQPCWGQMRPFVLRERSDECQPPTQPAYSDDETSPFYFEALEVYHTVKNLTAEQQEIARFWSDDPGKTGTPPGHSIAILTQVVRDQQLTLDEAAEAYARLGIAVADAFISCWQTKFATHVVRPVTYIRQFIDPGWNSPITTPPFPEYTSGHSIQAGAAATVLSDLFGAEYAFTDQTHAELGYVPRSFSSFDAMADEAAISRLYGGIHYRSAIDAGIEQGRCIGQRVNALQFHN